MSSSPIVLNFFPSHAAKRSEIAASVQRMSAFVFIWVLILVQVSDLQHDSRGKVHCKLVVS